MTDTATMAAKSYLANFKDTTFTKIFVGGLPYHTTTDTLREFFEKFGVIEEAAVINDRVTGKSKGYGFVTMADKAGAERAIADPNPIIDGRKANVNLAYLGAKPKLSYGALPASIAPKVGTTAVIPQQNSLMAAPYGYPPVTAASYGLPQGLLGLAGNTSLYTTQALPTTNPAQPEFSYAQLRSPAPAPTAANFQTNQLLAMAAMGYDVSQYMSAAGLGAYMYNPATAAAATPQHAAFGQLQQPAIVPQTPQSASVPERV